MKFKDKYDRERYEMGVEAAKAVSRLVNVMNSTSEGFVDTVLRDHPLLQQKTMKLFMECIWAWADAEPLLQNEATCALARKIKKAVGEYGYIPPLPYF